MLWAREHYWNCLRDGQDLQTGVTSLSDRLLLVLQRTREWYTLGDTFPFISSVSPTNHLFGHDQPWRTNRTETLYAVGIVLGELLETCWQIRKVFLGLDKEKAASENPRLD